MSTTAQKEATERQALALQATYEADSILVHLLENLPTEQEYLYLGALVRRVEVLNGTVMSILDGGLGTTIEDLRRVVKGGGDA